MFGFTELCYKRTKCHSRSLHAACAQSCDVVLNEQKMDGIAAVQVAQHLHATLFMDEDRSSDSPSAIPMVTSLPKGRKRRCARAICGCNEHPRPNMARRSTAAHRGHRRRELPRAVAALAVATLPLTRGCDGLLPSWRVDFADGLGAWHGT